MAARVRIELDRARVVDFCARNHIRWLALFGSVLRDDVHDRSGADRARGRGVRPTLIRVIDAAVGVFLIGRSARWSA